MHFLAERQQCFAHPLEVLLRATAKCRQSSTQSHDAIAAHGAIEDVPPSCFEDGPCGFLVGNRQGAHLDDNLAFVGYAGDFLGNIQDGCGIRQAGEDDRAIARYVRIAFG